MNEYFVIEPCQSANGIEIKFKERRIDLKKAENAFSEIGSVIAGSPVVLLARADVYSVSVYGSGRIMMKSQGTIDMEDAKAMARDIVMALEEKGAIL